MANRFLPKKTVVLLLLALSFQACQPSEKKETQQAEAAHAEAGTFGYDLDFLRSKDDSLIVLKDEQGVGQVLVSAKYQGKVFTSTADGLHGRSFGWINYEAFDAEPDPHMNAYGGENRFWLGPEGGRFSLFFKPGTDMVFSNWVTPPAIDTEPWHVVSSSSDRVSLTKKTELLNYAGTLLKASIKRDIRLLSLAEIEQQLGVKAGGNVKAVGFSTDNALSNVGEQPWTSQTGAPCIWILDMFNPSPGTVIVLPYKEQAAGKVATTDYFGEIPEDRILYNAGVLYFKADGKARGKLGLSPERAKPVAGSYDPTNRVLTITTFDVNSTATYLNQEWTTAKDPLKGDAVNAYNDGPLEDGSQMGPFYEIESVSPAAFLKPNQTLTHQHHVFHFVGEAEALNNISEKVLGVKLQQMEEAFRK
ncbi:hypothetical protein FVR03_17665 [Pontibacter qinzhouensis]|uniref:Lipoprotein n=1 Tax=Pontibacter qinzhouensis TaxID=2603253 RepID=A0A5C8JIE6_9BACT|nr:DUF6786 family protein [Pontibacter qinzhouensis]TXK36484.1 hypothetical protein FVR03_17665 [Pontibacter qinzhouensis]